MQSENHPPGKQLVLEKGIADRACTRHSAQMSGAAYQPSPILASDAELPPALVQLTERLAENTHELWAAQRLADGWTWGECRNDAAKKHPCLVAYAELPESERAYDRQTALGTLKAILALGYRVLPPDTN